MKFLNLDPLFKPFGESIEFEAFTFNGGEPHIKIKTAFTENEKVRITTRIQSFNDLGLVLIANDALRRKGVGTVELFIPYFPAARQDRLMQTGEALTVRVYAEIINQAKFDKVFIFDPHSEVTPALLNNVEVINNHDLVSTCLQDLPNCTLVSPDGGALKKIHQLSAALGGLPMIECGKTRNVKTGKLSGFKVYETDLNGANCLIVDDICDGGGTFIGLAKSLKDKGAGDLFLLVSHGIFSKGLDELCQYYKGIFSSDSFSSIDDPRLQQIDLYRLLTTNY